MCRLLPIQPLQQAVLLPSILSYQLQRPEQRRNGLLSPIDTFLIQC